MIGFWSKTTEFSYLVHGTISLLLNFAAYIWATSVPKKWVKYLQKGHQISDQISEKANVPIKWALAGATQVCAEIIFCFKRVKCRFSIKQCNMEGVGPCGARVFLGRLSFCIFPKAAFPKCFLSSRLSVLPYILIQG